MPDLKEQVQEHYVERTSWWTRFVVLLVIALTVIFVREVLEIYRIYQTEPAFLIGLVTAVVSGEFSIMYFIHRNKRDLVKESIRYEHDFEMRPMEATTPDYIEEYNPDSFEGVFPKDDIL